MASTQQQAFRSPESTPVNICLLQGQPSPGYCELIGLESPRRLLVQAGPGWNGAAVAFAGFVEQHFTIKIFLYTDKDWDDWWVWSQLFTRDATRFQKVGNTTVARAMDFFHPFASGPIHGIHSVTIENVKGPFRDGDTGSWCWEIPVVSTMKPQKSYAAVEGSKDQPLDAKDREMQDNATKIGANSSTIEALKKQRLPAPK